jgi:hypothetical protein
VDFFLYLCIVTKKQQTMSNFTEKTLNYSEITEQIIAKQVETNLNLYADPLTAAMQETGSNCFDTIVERQKKLGLDPTPYNIDVSQKGEYFQITFADEGLGMTKEQFLNHYWRIGNSSKKKDENQTGKFGIGAKSVLALSPSYIVVTKSHMDGVTHGYLLKRVDKDFDGEILPTFEYEEIEVDELMFEHGTVTRFNVKATYESQKSLINGLYQLALTGAKITISDEVKNRSYWDFELPKFQDVKIGNKTYLYTNHPYYKGKIVVGNIPYPTNNVITDYWVQRSPLIPTFNNSKVVYNETREYLKKDFDDTYGNKDRLEKAYGAIREGLKEEFYRQNDDMDCAELEYYKYLLNSDHPTITLDGLELDLSFTGQKMVAKHKKYGESLLDIPTKSLQNILPEIPMIDSQKFQLVEDHNNSIEKQYVDKLGIVVRYLEQQGLELICEGRVTQKNMGYYFDHLTDKKSVVVTTTPLNYLFPTDNSILTKIVKDWMYNRIQVGTTQFDFLLKVVDQYFEQLSQNIVDGKVLAMQAKKASYNFKKERGIKNSTYNKDLNIYVGARYHPYRQTFYPETIENSEKTYIYTVGRNTEFSDQVQAFSAIVSDYKKITKKSANITFIKFNKSDMKKDLKQWIEETDNVISEEEFIQNLSDFSKIWGTVVNYKVREKLHLEYVNLIDTIRYNSTLKKMFKKQLEDVKKLKEMCGLVTDGKYSWSSDLYRTNSNLHRFNSKAANDLFEKIEKANSNKFAYIQKINDEAKNVLEVAEWCNFLHSKEAFELSKGILTAKGIDYSELEKMFE